MIYVFKTLYLIFLLSQLIFSNKISSEEIIFFLIYLSLDIFREKYYNSIYLIALELFVAFKLASINPWFLILYGIIAFDMMRLKYYKSVAIIYGIGFYFLKGAPLLQYIFLVTLSIYFSYVLENFYGWKKSYEEHYDKERRYIRELELARQELINSSRELVHFTEIKERNRIAREIHDNIGHSLAGILMQLQAAYKLREKDREKSEHMISHSINGLSEALTLTRNTVHNIKPKEELGIEYIEKIIENFKFCTVEFNYRGNFNMLSSQSMGIIVSIVKEALTNVAKHSSAKKVIIKLEGNERFIRVYIKDDGVGSEKIKEGLGISGMRQRVKNLGGSLSIGKEEGFMIVAIIPVDKERGGVIFEDSNSR